ncbi:hypothetical protein FOZG_18169 [Fusarium oxysporum Fo47]|uniref:Uncharacterized protein n=1 Tax=Fusarium oxysporum Fo47 TaxID=660027 RepID=W9JEP4_FUSOX|nr:hypothetical protein FOZG_18169 [Fusarium oxysporum Fo47]
MMVLETTRAYVPWRRSNPETSNSRPYGNGNIRSMNGSHMMTRGFWFGTYVTTFIQDYSRFAKHRFLLPIGACLILEQQVVVGL